MKRKFGGIQRKTIDEEVMIKMRELKGNKNIMEEGKNEQMKNYIRLYHTIEHILYIDDLRI